MKKHLTFSLALLTIVCSTVTAQLPSYLPADGLVGWWPFNGNANDESGNGNDGVVNGATLTDDRNQNQNSAYYFDGISNEIVVSDNSVLDQLPQGSFTLSIWYNAGPESASNFDGLISRGWANSSTFFGFQIGRSGNQISFQTKGPDCGGQIHITSQGVWYNIVQVYAIADGYINSYVNGVLQSTETSCSAVVSQLNNDYDLKFGVEREGNLNFNGSLDDIAIYNRALTPQEIQNLFTGTNTGNTVDTGDGAAPLPQGIPYQAAARDAQGQVIADASVNVRFSLREGEVDGAVSYSETHALTTNSIGLFNTVFGNGTPEQSAFDSINWAATTKFLQVEIDLGDGYVDMGTTQLLSVPYAFRSDEAARIKNAGLPIFSDNAAALAGGLVAGEMYRTASGDLKIVY